MNKLAIEHWLLRSGWHMFAQDSSLTLFFIIFICLLCWFLHHFFNFFNFFFWSETLFLRFYLIFITIKTIFMRLSPKTGQLEKVWNGATLKQGKDRFMKKSYDSKFKSRVALEALRGDLTVAEIAGKYQIHSNLVQQWKKEAAGKCFWCLYDQSGTEIRN